MRLPISFVDLHYFVAVAEEENLHGASRRLAIAQPALSRRMKSLEVSLGVTLFDRGNRRIRLSRTGKEFLLLARRLLDQAEQAVEKTKRLSTGEEGWLSIGVSEFAVRDQTIKAIIRSFGKKHPNIVVDYQQMNKTPLIERIESEELDFAFMSSLSNRSIASPYISISQHELLAAFPDGFETAHPQEVYLSDFDGKEVIWYPPKVAPDVTNDLKSIFSDAGVTVEFKPTGLTEPGRLHFVSAGLGISIISSLSAIDHADAALLRPIKDLNVKLNLSGIWKSENDNPALRHFMAGIIETLGSVDQSPGRMPIGEMSDS